MQAKEFGLRIVIGGAIVKADKVLSTLICAHRDALLWEASILLDVPNFKDPVRIKSVDSTTSLIADHVDDVVVFERWTSSKVDRLENFSG